MIFHFHLFCFSSKKMLVINYVVNAAPEHFPYID